MIEAMFAQGIAAAKLLLAVALNTVGLAALLVAAWFMPRMLEVLVGIAAAGG